MFQEPEEEPWDSEQWRRNLIRGTAARCASEMWVSRPHEDLSREPPDGYIEAFSLMLRLTEDEKDFYRETYSRELELLGFQPSRWTRLTRDE